MLIGLTRVGHVVAVSVTGPVRDPTGPVGDPTGPVGDFIFLLFDAVDAHRCASAKSAHGHAEC